MNTSNWTVAYNSAIGNLHIRENIPCQDSSEYEAIDDNIGVAVVADGAGSYSNSHIGSQEAVTRACQYFKEIAIKQNWTTVTNLPTQEEWHKVSMKILRQTRDELTAIAKERGIYPNSLSSTIIVAIHAPDFLLITHIGDGRAGYSNGKKWKAAMLPYQGAEANETIFLMSDFWDVEEHVKRVVQSHIFEEEIEAFVLMTDGCEKSAFEMNMYNEETEKYFDPNRPFDKFLNPNLNGLRAMRRDGKTQDEINAMWKMFLEKGTKHFQSEVDDKTMILGVRQEKILIDNG
jgi:serine/threonine protein phosphatase PrpC